MPGRHAFRLGRAARTYFIWNLVTAAGLPLLLLGAVDHDKTLKVIGGVLLGLFLLDTAVVFPFLAARRQRRRPQIGDRRLPASPSDP